MEELIRVRGLKKYFPITQGVFIQREIGAVKAVDDVSFDIFRGETLGLVGESGCGKTTTGRTIIQLYKPTDGQVLYEDIDLTQMTGKDLRALRKRMQMIFQDPYASLNPRWTVSRIIGEPLAVHKINSGLSKQERVEELLETVSLNANYMNRYPGIRS